MAAAPVVAVGLQPEALAATGERVINFDVFWRDGKVGTHTVTFGGTPAKLTVRSKLDLVLKVAFVTVYRFKQTARDLWQEGTLVASSCETDDDGEIFRMEAFEHGRSLRVYGESGRHDYPLGTMTDFSIWNSDLVRQESVINVRTGELTSLTLIKTVRDKVEIAGTAVPAEATRFKVGDGRSGTVWYDAHGNWVKAVLNTRGQTFEYRLAT